MPLSLALLILCPQKVRMSSVENVPKRKYALAGVSTSICPACAAWSASTPRSWSLARTSPGLVESSTARHLCPVRRPSARNGSTTSSRPAEPE